MDNSGLLPILVPNDPASQVPAYTVAMRDALTGAANPTLAAGVTNFVPAEPAVVNRSGKLVTLQGRVSRSGSAVKLMTLPVGFRPTRQVHTLAIRGATTPVTLQIDALGEVATIFDTTANEFMICVTFSTV